MIFNIEIFLKKFFNFIRHAYNTKNAPQKTLIYGFMHSMQFIHHNISYLSTLALNENKTWCI